jgi:hypothetical protein
VNLSGPVDRRPQDELLQELLAGANDPDCAPGFVHFTLPTSESPKLLRLLAIENVSAATLFPGYAGVAEALIEQRYWDMARGTIITTGNPLAPANGPRGS